LKNNFKRTNPKAPNTPNTIKRLIIESLYSTFLPTLLLICSRIFELVTCPFVLVTSHKFCFTYSFFSTSLSFGHFGKETNRFGTD